MRLLKVEKSRAEEAIRGLLALHLIDRKSRVRRTGAHVYLPLTGPPPEELERLGEVVAGEAGPKTVQTPPYERIRQAAGIPARLKRCLPDRWEKYGHVVVLKLPPTLREYGREAAAAYAQVLGAETVLRDTSGSRGALREPTVELLLGERTDTVHLEDGIRYAFDAARIMFSSGNMAERMRMGTTVKSGETVVDMFAGIGYFSLPMAVHGCPKKVYACELNPVSYRYLVRNIGLNKVGGKVEPLEGDCRTVAPEGVADRVVLGHFDSLQFIPKAVRALGSLGGMLHVHQLCDERVDGSDPIPRVRRALEAAGTRAERLESVRVKSFKPRVWHKVVDVRLGAD